MTDPTIPDLVARLRELHEKLQALCPGCLSVLGLGEQPTEPEVYWRARESAAQPADESEGE